MATVLYVDDEAAIGRALARGSLAAATPCSPRPRSMKRSKILETSQVDGAFIDIWLGTESGFELFEWIDMNSPTSPANVVFVTGDVVPDRPCNRRWTPRAPRARQAVRAERAGAYCARVGSRSNTRHTFCKTSDDVTTPIPARLASVARGRVVGDLPARAGTVVRARPLAHRRRRRLQRQPRHAAARRAGHLRRDARRSSTARRRPSISRATSSAPTRSGKRFGDALIAAP